MDRSEEMAKLRAIISEASDGKTPEQLNEMFFFPKDKSPEGQRQTNKPSDTLGNRGDKAVVKDPAGYKRQVKGRGPYKDTWSTRDNWSKFYKVGGPKGQLPETDGAMDPELQALMQKYGVLEEGGCNMTAEGEQCPVHGLAECGGYMEEGRKDKKPDADGDGIPDWADKNPNKKGGKEDRKVNESDKPSEQEFDDQLALLKLQQDVDDGKVKWTNRGNLDRFTNFMKDVKADAVPAEPDMTPGSLRHYIHRDPNSATGTEHEELIRLMRDHGVINNETVDEAVHITVDGSEAEQLINRIAELAGTGAHVGPDVQSDMCSGCGCSMDQCTCDDGCCDDCGEYDCQCGEDDLRADMPMENADYDHGHDHHSSEGNPVNFKDWDAEQDPQRFVKSPGDNPLIKPQVKEDAKALFKKLKGDYKTYVAEAELARSNAGADSPLTANNRDEFDKDPFTKEKPVTDGTHSPLSTIKRQNVSK